ncbi:MAG: ABC transporter permease, partial [Longimicrobiales bacterium]
MDLFLDSAREAVRLLLEGNRYLWDIMALSLRVSTLAVLLGVLIGLPIGVLVAVTRFPGRRVVIALIHTGFALPPVV